MKTYHLRFTQNDFLSKQGSKWRTPLIDLYHNEQYKNYSSKKSQFGSNLLDNGTYTGAEAISETESEIGIVVEGNRFVDLSGRIDISAASISISNTELNFPATISVFTHSDDDATPYYMDNDPDAVNDWLRSEHRNPRYPILVINADRYAYFEIDFNSDFDTSELEVELIVTVRISAPTINHYFDSTKKIQNKFPEWMAIREYNALDEERATPKTPESIGGKFINASLGESLDDINKRLNLLIYNKFIDTIELDPKIWIYKVSAVPQKIFSIYGVIDEETIDLARSSSSTEFYESDISEDIFYHNTVTNEIYINKQYTTLYINNIEYPQVSHQLWHHLDDIGVTVDLFRLKNENNESFKKRILDVFINQPGVSIQRFKRAIRRELNLWKYSGATPATPDSFALGATPEVLEIKDIENSLEYFVKKMPTQKFIDLIKEISIDYPLIWGHIKSNQAVWDPDGVAHVDFGILPRQLDATPISSTYIDSGIIDGNDLFVFKPDQFTGSETFNASLKLRGAKRRKITIKPKVNFTVSIYGVGSYSTYTNPIVEENITIELTLNDNSKYYCNTVVSASNNLSAQYPNGSGNSKSIIEWTTPDGFTNARYIFSNYTNSVPYDGRINLSNVNQIDLKLGHFNGNESNPIYTTKANINDFKLWFQYSDSEFIGKDMATPSTSLVLSDFQIATLYPTICFQSYGSYEDATPGSWVSPLVNTYSIMLNNALECIATDETTAVKKDFKLTIPDNIIWPSYVTDRQIAVQVTTDINANGQNIIVSDASEAYDVFYSIDNLYVNDENSWINSIQLFDDSTEEITFSYDEDLEIDKWDLFEATQSTKNINGKVNQFGPWKNDEEPIAIDKDFFLTRVNVSREDFDLINGEQAPEDWIYSPNYMVTWIGIDDVDNEAVSVWLLGNSIYPLVYDGNFETRTQSLGSQIEEIIEDDIYSYGAIPIFARLKPGVNQRWNPKLHSGWFFDTDETYYLYADPKMESATGNYIVLSDINRQGAPIIVKALSSGTPVLDLKQVAFYDNDATPELSIINKETFVGNGTNTLFAAYKNIYNINVTNLTLNEPVSVLSSYSLINEIKLINPSNSDFTYEVSYKVKGSFYADNNFIDTDGQRKTKIVFDSTPQLHNANQYQVDYETSIFDVATPVDISLNSLYSSIDESFIFIDKNTYDLSQIEIRISSSKILADGIDYVLLTFRAIDVNGNPKPSATFNVYTNFGYINPSTVTTDNDGFGWAILKSEPWSNSLAPTPSHISLPIPAVGSTPVQGTVLVDGDVDASILFQIDIPTDKQKYIAAVADPNQVSANSASAVFITGAVRNADHTPIPYAVVYWRKERTVNELLSNNTLHEIETNLTDSSSARYGYVVSDSLGFFSIGPFRPSTVAGYWFVSTQTGSASPDFTANQFPVIGDVVYWYEYPNSSIRDTTRGAIQYATPTDLIPDYSYDPIYPIGVDENTWTSQAQVAPINVPGATPSRWGSVYQDQTDPTIKHVDRPSLGAWLPPLWYGVDKFQQYQIGLNNLKSGTNEIGLDITSATPLYPDYKEF